MTVHQSLIIGVGVSWRTLIKKTRRSYSTRELFGSSRCGTRWMPKRGRKQLWPRYIDDALLDSRTVSIGLAKKESLSITATISVFN